MPQATVPPGSHIRPELMHASEQELALAGIGGEKRRPPLGSWNEDDPEDDGRSEDGEDEKEKDFEEE
jgi:hypothetical protein